MIKVSSQDLHLKNSVAMTVTLISFGMLFATLFLSYFLLRFNSASWPPIEIDELSVFIPTLSTIFIVLSSLSFYLYQSKQKLLFLTSSHLFGVGFILSQFKLWESFKTQGIFASTSMISSMLYAFTWLHVGHMVLGLIGLTYLWVLSYSQSKSLSDLKIINIGKFWHFLGFIWIMMYLILFIF